MTSDQQVALARGYSGTTGNLSKATRQIVPAFLQKLYEMVSDSSSDLLIKWSDNGDSFYVLDQERFAREVLGRWFKHNKFTSFVRQLNMYGFHKIPHLQQGVLKSENETELWNFEHPSFHRGQPDLLCLIQRKRQGVPGPGEDGFTEARDASATASTATSAGQPGQLLDINSIVNGISAIKRHQTAISADLNQLKDSNQHLWQEAIAARERHKKHQDTINRILKFLAGVFGHGAGQTHKDNPVNVSNVVSRKRQRLMIEDGRDKGTMSVEEDGVPDLFEPQLHSVNLQTPTPSERFVSLDTPTVSETSPTSSELRTDPLHFIPDSSGHPFSTPSASDASVNPTHLSTRSPSATLSSANGGSIPSSTGAQPVDSWLTPPARNSLSPVNGNNSESLQAAFNQMINEPGQLQRLIAALQSQQTFPLQPPSNPPHSDMDARSSDSHLDQHFSAFSDTFPSEALDDFDTTHPENYRPPSSLAVLPSSLPKVEDTIPYEPLLESTNNLQNSCKDAAAIGAEVDAMQTSINSLIESLGLDPQMLQLEASTSPSQPGNNSLSSDFSGDIQVTSDSSASDFLDFDAFLNDLSRNEGHGTDYTPFADAFDHAGFSERDIADAPSEESTAFLDEVVTSPSDTASPAATRVAEVHTVTAGRKRKSNFAELPDLSAGVIKDSRTLSSNSKTRRKR